MTTPQRIGYIIMLILLAALAFYIIAWPVLAQLLWWIFALAIAAPALIFYQPPTPTTEENHERH